MLLFGGSVFGTARPQTASRELSLSDIRAEWPQETLFASNLCQRVLEDPDRREITRPYDADPKTFVQDLNDLKEKSDEIVLVGVHDGAVVLSPSRESVTTYIKARVIRSWKGSHHVGDVLVFGVPAGTLACEPSSSEGFTRRFEVTGPYIARHNLYVLFLRQSQGPETKLVQGLLPAAGAGVQGIFEIPLPTPRPRQTNAEDYCAGILGVNVPHCEAIVKTLQSPVAVPYARDPLAKKYAGMPASDFLREVQSVATAQGLAEKSTPK